MSESTGRAGKRGSATTLSPSRQQRPPRSGTTPSSQGLATLHFNAHRAAGDVELAGGLDSKFSSGSTQRSIDTCLVAGATPQKRTRRRSL